MSDDTVTRPPVRLWLQWNGDAASTTWTDEPVFDLDIEYIRPAHTLSQSTLDSLREWIEEVLNHTPPGEQDYNHLMHVLALLPEAS